MRGSTGLPPATRRAWCGCVALGFGQRAIDVFGALFARPIEGSDLLGMATGESLAHVNHLVARGEVAQEPGADGALRYQLRTRSAASA